jgi:hypothetical protein
MSGGIDTRIGPTRHPRHWLNGGVNAGRKLLKGAIYVRHPQWCSVVPGSFPRVHLSGTVSMLGVRRVDCNNWGGVLRDRIGNRGDAHGIHRLG